MKRLFAVLFLLASLARAQDVTHGTRMQYWLAVVTNRPDLADCVTAIAGDGNFRYAPCWDASVPHPTAAMLNAISAQSISDWLHRYDILQRTTDDQTNDVRQARAMLSAAQGLSTNLLTAAQQEAFNTTVRRILIELAREAGHQ